MLTRTLMASIVLALAASGLGTAGQAHAAPPAGMPVYRAQLYVRVCDASSAGTDKKVAASLTVGKYTFMNYGRNDFERNSEFTYDLNLDGIETIDEVTRLRIRRVDGDDAVKLCRITLRVNGRDIYTRSFGTGLWLDDDGRTARQFHVDRGTMEDGSLWINYLRPGFSPVIPRGEMVSRVEALVGDGIAGTTLHWGHLGGSGYVETRGTNSTTMAVDLDLAYSLELADYDLPGDPAVDVDFYLLFSCSNGRLRIQPDWVWVDTPFWWDTVFGPAEFDFRVKRRFENLLDAVTVNLGRLGRCPSINVLSDGTVLFS